MPFDSQATPDLTARATEIVASQVAARAAHPRIGVCFSGMGYDAPPEIETVEAVALRLEREHTERAEWRLTPDGRFYVAAHLIAEATGDDRLLNCHSRGLRADADRAAKLLATMSGPAADAARAALVDFAQDQMVSA